jgi:hypothetical protein
MIKTLLASLVCLASTASATIILENAMSREEQHRTGVDTLNRNQKAALEAWINKNFMPKNPTPEAKKLYLSVNLEGGKRLILSDGTNYEIHPQDLTTTAVWITPFPIKVAPSGDINYPFMLTNMNTGVTVKARQVPPQTQQQPPMPMPQQPGPSQP